MTKLSEEKIIDTYKNTAGKTVIQRKTLKQEAWDVTLAYENWTSCWNHSETERDKKTEDLCRQDFLRLEAEYDEMKKEIADGSYLEVEIVSTDPEPTETEPEKTEENTELEDKKMTKNEEKIVWYQDEKDEDLYLGYYQQKLVAKVFDALAQSDEVKMSYLKAGAKRMTRRQAVENGDNLTISEIEKAVENMFFASQEDAKMLNSNSKSRKYFKYSHEDAGALTDWTISDGKNEVAVSTNLDGEGLWIEGRQVRGTSEFRLPATKQGLDKKLKKVFFEYRDILN